MAVVLAQRLGTPYDRVLRMRLADALVAQLDAVAVQKMREEDAQA